MGDATGQPADRFQALGLVKLVFQLFLSFFSL